MRSPKIFVTALSVIASIAYAGSAQAIGLRLNLGMADNPNTNGIETGEQGGFSDYYDQTKYPSFSQNAVTVDFNDQISGNTFVYSKNGDLLTDPNSEHWFAKYTLQNGAKIISGELNQSGKWIDREGRWAPTGPTGEKNQSNYLQVFKRQKVVIDLKEDLNYFGINWGAISPKNKFSFYNGDTLIQTFDSTDDLLTKVITEGENKNAVKASHQTNEYNTFVHFYAENADQTFNRIEMWQDGGGGFENDNHSFHIGNGAFDPDKGVTKVPEPSLVFGMLAVGGVFFLKYKKQKSLPLG
ncbi:MAG: PEP-CTERM sorting domain-containing protein [Nostocaceae cyanobacterium]|nr:PEP-CTERM sorting domain-containing protein [Nostocaceae cyanobacterium]